MASTSTSNQATTNDETMESTTNNKTSSAENTSTTSQDENVTSNDSEQFFLLKAQNAFNSIADLVQADLQGTVNEYRCLNELNNVAAQKYANMHLSAANIAKSVGEANDKYRALAADLEQIPHLEECLEQLETAAHRLDAYAKKLEIQFKKLEKS